MKKLILFLITGLFIFSANDSYSGRMNSTQDGEQINSNTITIVSSPEVSDFSAAIVAEYRKNNSEQDIIFVNEADGKIPGSIRFFSDSRTERNSSDATGLIAVAHEIIVPVMNENNPLVKVLEEEGITSDDFAELLGVNPAWKNITDNSGDAPVQVFIADNPRLISRLAEFAEVESTQLLAGDLVSAKDLLLTVQTNEHAIGFSRLSEVLDAEKNGFADGIKIVPVDKNRNGQIDRFEQIFNTPAELTRGVWIGKYPKKLSIELYAAPVAGSFDEASAGFLTWVLNEGQESMATMGYSHLLTSEKTAGMNVLKPVPSSDFPVAVPLAPVFGIVAIGLISLVFLVIILVRIGRKSKSRIHSEDINLTPALNSNSIKAPGGLYYDKTHTWAFMEQDGRVKIGVNDFLQHVTGTFSEVRMKSPGERVRKGEKILTVIREGKQLDICSPVTGIIKTKNNMLIERPSGINTDPYLTGWVYQIEPTNWLRETKFMFMAEQFSEWLDDEFVRLKDFLAAKANTDAVVYNHIVLQDGGELADNVLANMEPKVWVDFQSHFLDVSR